MDAPLIPTGPAQNDEARDIEENKDIAAFSYLWVMSVLVYFLKKQSPFARYHSKQAMVLFAVSIVVWFIPFINRVLELIVLACMAYGFINAAQGKKQDVPIAGPLSRGEMTLRQAWKEITALVVRLVHAIKDLAKPETKAPPEPKQEPKAETPPAPETPPSPPSPPQP